jgi:hypothetical protein
MPPSSLLAGHLSRYAAYVFGLFVFGVGILLDVVLIELGAPRLLTLLFDDLLTGVAAGIAVGLALRSERRRRQEETHRLQVLDELNHHVRNALQVMALHSYSIGGDEGLELSRAVQRIQWSLTEILPKVNFDMAAVTSPNPEFTYQPVKKQSRSAS